VEFAANRVDQETEGPTLGKYLMKENYYEELKPERESIAATLEILADQELTARLMSLGRTIDRDVEKGRLLTAEEVFEKCRKSR